MHRTEHIFLVGIPYMHLNAHNKVFLQQHIIGPQGPQSVVLQLIIGPQGPQLVYLKLISLYFGCLNLHFGCLNLSLYLGV